MPGEVTCLVGEERTDGVRRYFLTNYPATASLRTLAQVIKARWSCEQAHQQLKEELGLDHFEGRSWRGLHHHAVLTMLSLAFLQHLRLREPPQARGEKKLHALHGPRPGPPPHPTVPMLRQRLLTQLTRILCCCPHCHRLAPMRPLG